MADLVKQLRRMADWCHPKLLRKAAEEIERLHRQLDGINAKICPQCSRLTDAPEVDKYGHCAMCEIEQLREEEADSET